MRNPFLQDLIQTTKHATVEAYSRVWEHYADEMRLLDMKLGLLFAHRQHAASDPQADAMRGMYVSEDEFWRMVGYADEPAPDTLLEWERIEAEIEELRQEIDRRVAATVRQGVFLPIEHIRNVFRLTDLEGQLVLCCLAVELDRKYERIFGFLADDLTVRLPTVALALELICRTASERRAARMLFAPEGGLFRHILARDEGEPFGRTLLSRTLCLDGRIVAFLLDTGALDEQVAQYAAIYYPDEPLPDLLLHHDIQERLVSALGLALEAPQSIGLYVHGLEGAGKRLHIRHACASRGKSLLLADARVLAASAERFEERWRRLLREALLQQTVLVVEHLEVLLPEEPDKSERERLRLFQVELGNAEMPIVLLSETELPVRGPEWGKRWLGQSLPVPDAEQRLALWRRMGEEAGIAVAGSWAGYAAKFRFTPGQMRSAIEEAGLLAKWEGKTPEEVLEQACYRQMRHRLDRKATRIEPRYGWEDIVLPEEQKDLLRNACNQMTYRTLVYGSWGFERKLAYGKGLSMLFAGPPGTGKTMAAQVVAKELRMELYKIDLSQVVSKYIGETEKNLHEIFREGRKSGAILFFDETDALFGKRSEVKDAHDKYANIETAYLLQKMEEYDGISVLATNLLNNIDEAFLRRLNYVIKFPFPDAFYRENIWRSAFPPETPIAADVDFRRLAERYEIAGGNIKNIALSAAFLAAGLGTAVGMSQLLSAVRHELQKSGKIMPRQELEDY